MGTKYIKRLYNRYNQLEIESKEAKHIYIRLKCDFLDSMDSMNSFNHRTLDAIKEISEYRQCLSNIQADISKKIFGETENRLLETEKIIGKYLRTYNR